MDEQHLPTGLKAISPLDGRYQVQLAGLESFLSEAALIRYRLLVEARWLLYLETHLPQTDRFSAGVRQKLETWALAPSDHEPNVMDSQAPSTKGLLSRDDLQAAQEVKRLEQTTNHDVKAVEYYMREELKKLGASDKTLAMIHFGATSEDINNLAYGLMLKHYRRERLLPLLDQMVGVLSGVAHRYRQVSMLGRTHGQPATPTTMGKEIGVFVHRVLRQRKRLRDQAIEGKINGAVGNFNAHMVAFPDVAWESMARGFVQESMGLTYNPLTTQIENHDSLVEFLEVMTHTMTILIGLCRDMWSYIGLGYFKQKTVRNEVGSSTMPHKVNPIDFENAEGNFGISTSLARHFCEKLPISRWQRDLSDSTVLRSLGVIFGHGELGLKSLIKGLHKVELDDERIRKDLDEAWEVLAEPLQTVLRKHGVVDAYERLKEATRGQHLTREAYLRMVDLSVEIPEGERQRLRQLTPRHYIGLAPELLSNLEGILSTLHSEGGVL